MRRGHHAQRERRISAGRWHAIRRSIFEAIGCLARVGETRSATIILDACAGAQQSSIVFHPGMLDASYVETDFQGLLEFTNRKS